MDRRASMKLIGLAIGIYGYSVAVLVPGLAIGAAPLLLAGVVAEAVAAFATAIGLWRAARWAPGAAVALGATIVVMQLLEGPVFGLIATGRAVLVGAGALLLMIVIAGYASGTRRARLHA